MRLLWFIGLTAGLVSACATTQPASDTANATIAKQVALADEAYELGRYGTASSRYRQALLYARSEDAQLIAPLLHNLGTSLQQSRLARCAGRVQEAFDLYQSIGDDTGSLMSLLGRATCEHALRAPKAKETLEDVLKRATSLGNAANGRPCRFRLVRNRTRPKSRRGRGLCHPSDCPRQKKQEQLGAQSCLLQRGTTPRKKCRR